MAFFTKIKNKLFPCQQGMITLSLQESLSLFSAYAFVKIRLQFKAVFMVSVFLAATQYFILGMPLYNALSVFICVGAVILGLSFFLEGLFLGIMPLGEQCGMKLPAKIGVAGLTVFSIIVGITIWNFR
jgi:NADH:ubiquinone oxidoreductase subunit 6 (subunit J)